MFSFPKKKPLGDSGTPGGFISELKLRTTSSALRLLNFPDGITWITSNDKENLEICPFLETR